MAELRVGLDDALEGAQARGTATRRLDVAAEEVGVAAVKEPALLLWDGDRGVPEGVAGERDEQEVRDRADAFKPQPLVAPRLVRDPVGAVCPVGLAHDVSPALAF